jgi:hypothetical protein
VNKTIHSSQVTTLCTHLAFRSGAAPRRPVHPDVTWPDYPAGSSRPKNVV